MTASIDGTTNDSFSSSNRVNESTVTKTRSFQEMPRWKKATTIIGGIVLAILAVAIFSYGLGLIMGLLGTKCISLSLENSSSLSPILLKIGICAEKAGLHASALRLKIASVIQASFSTTTSTFPKWVTQKGIPEGKILFQNHILIPLSKKASNLLEASICRIEQIHTSLIIPGTKIAKSVLKWIWKAVPIPIFEKIKEGLLFTQDQILALAKTIYLSIIKPLIPLGKRLYLWTWESGIIPLKGHIDTIVRKVIPLSRECIQSIQKNCVFR